MRSTRWDDDCACRFRSWPASTRNSAKLALSDEQLGELRHKHGGLENWWRERYGFGFEALTQSEARYLARTADADTIRNRVAAAGQGQDGGDR